MAKNYNRSIRVKLCEQCKIKFDHEPSPAKNSFNPKYKFSIPEQQAIDNEVTEFLSKSIIKKSILRVVWLFPQFLRNQKKGIWKISSDF